MRKIVIATLTTTLALSLSACASGANAPTAMTKQVTDGVEASIDAQGSHVKVAGLLLVAQHDGSAVLVATMVNEGEVQDDLLAIAAGGVMGTLSATSLPMLQNKALRFAGDSANSTAIFPALNIAPGNRVKVQLFFSHAGEMTVDAIVREQAGVYAGVTS